MDRIFAGFIGIPFGFILIVYRFQLKQFTGDIQWAEEHLGSGGTYNLFILIGLGVSILSLMYVLGTVQGFFTGTLGSLFGVS